MYNNIQCSTIGLKIVNALNALISFPQLEKLLISYFMLIILSGLCDSKKSL